MKLKIKCPDCKTSYEIPSDKIGAEGRTVKCTRCGTSWRATAEEPLSKSLDEKEADAEWQQLDRESAARKAEANKGSYADDEEEEDVEPPEEPADPDDASGDEDGNTAVPGTPANAAEPSAGNEGDKDKTKSREKTRSRYSHLAKPKHSTSKRLRRLTGLGLFAASLLACVMTVSYRDTIVRQFPDLAGLYQMVGLTVNLRGLEFRDLRTFREVQDGVTVLVVEGSIENITNRRVEIPAVRLSLRSHDFSELYAWTVEPRLMTLDPATKTRFRTRLAQPPDRAADIQMRFVERQQRRASTR
ncbi:zinc-ribbon domain-containing protein [Pseudovibrio exalbescens]|uniref:MJ0042-type zinc finger domain-containing protein n=1 Tax=Pseudovibrio exalbescens TaxID=197461 RepID=UPI002365FE2C|nr:MJ0042-type zinc finger domain-containing protein [Pseudovibrio exalbescens]MDD7909478.1 zinc-ribbon domain-containing protein [Pseudovibrio exalbescens]